MNRRDFLRQAGGVLAAESLVWAQVRKGGAVSIVLDPSDSVASAAPVRWAAGELQQAISAAGLTVRRVDGSSRQARVRCASSLRAGLARVPQPH